MNNNWQQIWRQRLLYPLLNHPSLRCPQERWDTDSWASIWRGGSVSRRQMSLGQGFWIQELFLGRRVHMDSCLFMGSLFETDKWRWKCIFHMLTYVFTCQLGPRWIQDSTKQELLQPYIPCLKRPSLYCLIHFYKRCVSALALTGRSPEFRVECLS